MGKPTNKREVYLVCALLIAVTAAVYWQVREFDFTNFDDQAYVQNNTCIADGLTFHGVRWALTTTYQFIWMPLVWISYMADHDLSPPTDSDIGADPGVCHLTNVVLHIANVLLLFVILRWMTDRTWPSAFVAALFAVHPLHVESVAWICERKDVLSTLFWLLTMLAYLRYVHRPGPWRYACVLLAYAMGLMSKPMLVTLPIALLIIDYWPLKWLGTGKHRLSFWQVLREKIPMFVMAIPCAVVTIASAGVAGAGASANSGVLYPFGVRAANAFVSYIRYVEMTFWPRNLAVFYPHPASTLPTWQVVGSVIVFVVLCVLAVRTARTRPYLTAGWLWFVITLIPVIGFVQVGKAALADRFTYVPSIGLFVAIAWGASDLLSRLSKSVPGRIICIGLATTLIGVLTVCSHLQVGYWRDSYTLFSHAIRVTGPNALAHYNLGLALQEMGRTAEAIRHYRESLRIDPNDADVKYTLARCLTDLGSTADLDEAIRLFRAAVDANPEFGPPHNCLGVALAKRGRLDEAISEFRQALRIDADMLEAQSNLAKALALKRQHHE